MPLLGQSFQHQILNQSLPSDCSASNKANWVFTQESVESFTALKGEEVKITYYKVNWKFIYYEIRIVADILKEGKHFRESFRY